MGDHHLDREASDNIEMPQNAQARKLASRSTIQARADSR
jgi:hypothetical protein